MASRIQKRQSTTRRQIVKSNETTITKPKAKVTTTKVPTENPTEKTSKSAYTKQPATKTTPILPETSKKRSSPHGPDSSRQTKKVKHTTQLNTTPSQRLNVYVFGSGQVGELGLGPKKKGGPKVVDVKYPRLHPFLDAEKVGVVQIAVGGMHCVALTHDQQILTWGVNDLSALGRDTTWEAPTRDADDSDSDEEGSDLNPLECIPTAIPAKSFGPDVADFAQVVATNSASFVLTVDGLVYGWGTFSANDGLFGFSKDDTMNGVQIQKTPILIPGLKNIKSLAAGADYVLALDHKGNVLAWGAYEQSQLGRQVVQRRRFNSLVPMPVGVTKVASISAGSYHGFAVDIKGQVWGWGLNNFGQIGIASGDGQEPTSITRATVIKDLKPYQITDIKGGTHHSIACADDGTLLTWGRCDDSQIGIAVKDLPQKDLLFDSRQRPRILTRPTIVPGIKAVSVAAGIDNCMAVNDQAQAYSWGFSAGYRTGLGTDDSVEVPTLMANSAVRDKKISFVGCGGQFSVLAGPADL